MFIKIIYFNFLLYVAQIDGKVFKSGPLLDNSLDEPNEPNAKWQGLWFPHPPNSHNDSKMKNANVAHLLNIDKKSDPSNSATTWPGTWFPHPPRLESHETPKTLSRGHHFDEFLAKDECDNGKTNIAIDFDPEDERHSYNYLCLDNRTEYEPNLNTSALLMEHFVPSAYQPPVRCVSEEIIYDESPPTFGPYRPLAPKFGSYKYLPPQRWLHSLSDGAIVLLYHPCAFPGQIRHLSNTLQGCLYRHIITPSQLLTSKRPLALLAWGKCLQMSVVDDNLVVKFIKENAKLGLRGQQSQLHTSSAQYEAGLGTEAHLVTDEQDKEICGYKEM